MMRIMVKAAAASRDRKGVALIEFALVLPLLLLLFLGGYEVSDAISCNRKVTITTRATADLVSQYSIISASQVDSILAASTQVMVPYSASNALVRVSEISTDGLGKATVTWSRALNGTKLTPGATFTLPAGITAVNTSYIFGEVNYAYTPPVTYGLVKPMGLKDSLYMLPRVSSSVSCDDC